MAELGKCSKHFYDGWTRVRCSREAIVERDGLSFCKVHDPEYIAERTRKRQEKWDAKRKVRDASDALAFARNDAIRGLTLEELKRLTPNLAKAAPLLYEACKAALEFMTEFDVIHKVISGLSLQLNEALASVGK